MPEGEHFTPEMLDRDEHPSMPKHKALALQADKLQCAIAPPEKENPTCAGCGGPHPFDTSVPSVDWNRVIRSQGLPEYLCLTCIVKAFATAKESFTASLWSQQWDGLPIQIAFPLKGAYGEGYVRDEKPID